jgi:hypothetical protein
VQAVARSGSALAPVGLRVGLTSLVLLSIALAVEHTPLTPGPGMPQIWPKRPMAYRFPPREFAFSSSVAGALDGRNLLAPEAIINVLPLLNTTIRLESARTFQTRFTFTSAGLAHEGQQRLMAQRLVADCRDSADRVWALEAAVGRGVDAVVIGPCRPARRARVKSLFDALGTWSIYHESEGYTLLLRGDAAG